MPGILPILIGGPKPPPALSKRQLLKQQQAAEHAAKGHREAVAKLTEAAHGGTAGTERAGLLTMAATHEAAASEYEAQASAAAEAAAKAK